MGLDYVFWDFVDLFYKNVYLTVLLWNQFFLFIYFKSLYSLLHILIVRIWWWPKIHNFTLNLSLLFVHIDYKIFRVLEILFDYFGEFLQNFILCYLKLANFKPFLNFKIGILPQIEQVLRLNLVIWL